jgi:hypothetical protein
MIYNVSYIHANHSGTIPIQAKSRKQACETVSARFGGCVAVVTGMRSA